MKIEIDYKPPNNCMDCKFFRGYFTLEEGSMAMCVFSDRIYKWNDLVRQEMRKSCPFLKTKMGYIESRDIEGAYK